MKRYTDTDSDCCNTEVNPSSLDEEIRKYIDDSIIENDNNIIVCCLDQ